MPVVEILYPLDSLNFTSNSGLLTISLLWIVVDRSQVLTLALTGLFKYKPLKQSVYQSLLQ